MTLRQLQALKSANTVQLKGIIKMTTSTRFTIPSIDNQFTDSIILNWYSYMCC